MTSKEKKLQQALSQIIYGAMAGDKHVCASCLRHPDQVHTDDCVYKFALSLLGETSPDTNRLVSLSDVIVIMRDEQSFYEPNGDCHDSIEDVIKRVESL